MVEIKVFFSVGCQTEHRVQYSLGASNDFWLGTTYQKKIIWCTLPLIKWILIHNLNHVLSSHDSLFACF